MAGHHPSTMMGSSFYSGTKFAVTALTEGLRKELRDIKSNIKIIVRCNQSDLHYNMQLPQAVSPGVVATEFAPRLLEMGDPKEAVKTSLTFQ